MYTAFQLIKFHPAPMNRWIVATLVTVQNLSDSLSINQKNQSKLTILVYFPVLRQDLLLDIKQSQAMETSQTGHENLSRSIQEIIFKTTATKALQTFSCSCVNEHLSFQVQAVKPGGDGRRTE